MSLNSIIKQEAIFAEELLKLKSEIEAEITNTDIPGVTKLGKNCCTVKLSGLSSWSPEYYNANAQAAAVYEYLKKCSTATQILSALNEMVETGYAFSKSKNRVRLNSTTINILKKFREKEET